MRQAIFSWMYKVLSNLPEEEKQFAVAREAHRVSRREVVERELLRQLPIWSLLVVIAYSYTDASRSMDDSPLAYLIFVFVLWPLNFFIGSMSEKLVLFTALHQIGRPIHVLNRWKLMFQLAGLSLVFGFMLYIFHSYYPSGVPILVGGTTLIICLYSTSIRLSSLVRESVTMLESTDSDGETHSTFSDILESAKLTNKRD